mmetsp:Transcript_20255/g.42478  ORF Transcript_20255/g.42478 Transcript_20255/m.42478 type:complete len:202 (+) Transcript_20255:2039-2644(+)
MYCSMFSLRTSNWVKPAVRFFILYALIPAPPTPKRAAPALNVASTVKNAADDAVPAPVRAARPPIPAARAGAASPPVIAKIVPRVTLTPAIFNPRLICLIRSAFNISALLVEEDTSPCSWSPFLSISLSFPVFPQLGSSVSLLSIDVIFCNGPFCSFFSFSLSFCSRSWAMRKRTISIAISRSINSNLRVARNFALNRRFA